MTFRRLQNWLSWGVFLTGLGFVLTNLAFAMGGEQPPKETCPAPGTSVPVPVRAVLPKTVATKAFRLPNGAMVNLNADLDSMLSTAISESGAYVARDPGFVGSCGRYLEIRPAVTTLEMEATSVRVRFGYSPGGEIVPITSINGEVGVKIGTVAMDFSIWECTPGQPCRSVVAATSNQSVLGTDVNFTVNFGTVTTGVQLIHNSALGEKLRRVMGDAMRKLATHARINQLYWDTKVLHFDGSTGVITLGAGRDQGLKTAQTFEVYAPMESGMACNLSKVVAYLHTTDVNSVSSQAVVDAIFDSNRGILPGDVVMIRVP